MRKLIVSEFVTLDGVMEAPGGEPSHPHTGWVLDHQGPEQVRYKFDEVLEAGTLLVGRVTYESFAGAWPTYTGEFADRMNSMEKVVVSGTLTDPEWNNTTVLAGDVVKGVAGLKERDGGPIVVQGSGTLVHTLLDHDLVDELRLMVFPVTIGSGLRLFPDTVRKTAWRVSSGPVFPSGVRVDVYPRV
ncbi:dihydrofolate reductase family protein [Streptomyces specialis]|uniref:dihydrofolate reductase family protein n=1 Tax=Streptomyces specialis TaxID=498367 RepID=UPI00073EBE8B|nr:dihydrofolate reductase family protein [Streptomyces specialis]